MMNKKIKIGVLLDSFNIPSWAYAMLEKIQQSDYAEITLVIMNRDPNVPVRISEVRRVVSNRQKILFRAYIKLESKLFKYSPNAFEIIDATDLLAEAQHVHVHPRKTKYLDYIEGEDVDVIRKHDVDVLVRLGFRILRGEILRVPRFGVWSYHHGDNIENRGGAPGFWELLGGKPVIGSMLQVLTEDLDNGLVLYKSFSQTHPLLSRTINYCHWRSALFVPRKLKELHDLGGEKFLEKLQEENKHPLLYSSRLFTTPNNLEVVKFICRQLRKISQQIFSKLLFLEQWALWFDLRDGISTSFRHFKKIVPPKDRFWADPFVVFKDGKYYIFVEDLKFAENKGRISVLTVDESGLADEPQVVLEKPYHLSYPFVFEWEGTYYMLPETMQNRTIEIYKCVNFPDKWEFHKNLMEDINAVDATLFQHDGKWWLFANVNEITGASELDELFIYYADNPLSSSWTPHARNPVVSDVRRARPAGKVFLHKGGIYRPSQDCSFRYGYGLNINNITKLSETEYEERVVSHAKPEWNKSVSTVHTFNHDNRLTVIDAICYRPKASWYVLLGLMLALLAHMSISPPIDLPFFTETWERVFYRGAIVGLALLLIAFVRFKKPVDN